MHEFSIASGISETVLTFAESRNIQRVVEVRLTIGELTCIEVDQLRFCFEAITPGSALEGCALEIEKAAAVVRCSGCGYQGPPKYWEEALAAAPIPTLQCPTCGRTAEAIEGHGCAIKSIKFLGDEATNSALV
jgi:hydrogenase nickel incorporation protein HypA/HybF